MFDLADYEEARTHAEEFNRRKGATLLVVADRPHELVTLEELRALADRSPGAYLASSAYQQIKGRKPSHGENVKLGQMLGFLMVARRKDGPQTLWLLDKAFAERTH